MISASARRLSVFKSVVDNGGFNIAANHLGITQPSVGAHIKALEEQLGQPLFHRSRGTRPRLTKAGEAMYAFAVDVLRRSESATKTLDGLRSAKREITIAVQRDVASHFLPERLTAFTGKHPKVHVITRVGTADEVIELVRTREAAVGMFFDFRPVSGIRCEVVYQDRLVLVASPKHILVGRYPVALRELERARFVVGLRQSRFFRMTDAALKQIGLASYDIAMEVQESNATKEIVRRGGTIACLPISAVASDLDSGALVSLSLSTPLPQPNVYCAYMNPLNDLARSLMKCLHAKGAHPD